MRDFLLEHVMHWSEILSLQCLIVLIHPSNPTGGLRRIDQLAQLESKAQGAQGRGTGAAAAEDAQPIEAAPEVDTDDEEDMENDDYYQGQTWDDDEGYGDDGGDDGDGEAFY